MSARNRERRQSAARKRAENHATGFETTLLRIPEGVTFFEAKAGIKTIDIVPFKAGKGNPFAEPGGLYFERTFWCWRYIGAEEKTYACLHKTFGEKDPVQEWKNEEAKNPNADQSYLKALQPKERQLFLVWDGVDPKKLQIWEVSHHLFGKLLDSRIKNSDERMGWDQFYFPDDGGMSLRLTFEEQSGGGYSWLEVTAIDFIPRDNDLPDSIVNHGICLDELIVKTPYAELRKVFLGVDGDEGSTSPARKEEKQEKKPEPEKPKEEKQEKQPESEKPKEEKKPNPITAESRGLKPQDEVVYQKTICTIAKISPDGTSLTLLDANDDLIKGVSPSDVKPMGGPDNSKKSEPEKPKEEKKQERSRSSEKETESFEKTEDEDKDDDDWDFK